MPRHVGFAAAVCGLLLSPAGAAGVTAAPDQCAPARRAQHRAWQTRPSAREQPSDTTGARVRHFPTATMGVWVVETSGPGGSSMTRVAPDALTRLTWTAACVVTADRQPRPRGPASAFGDADLAALVRTGRGVIYVWSPHMPLSVDTMTSLAAAARGLRLAVTLLLDPAADPGFAARIAAERALPAAALRVADSVELQFRDVLVHAPTAIAYADGRIVGSAYPGGHTADEYAAYFRRVLAATR